VDGEVNPRRAYRKSTRGRQRAATRAAIIDAAAEAFVESGYAATAIAAIAARADVSPETVYAIFKNKRELLRQVIETTAAGDRPAVVDESWLTKVRAEPDQRRRLTLMGVATQDVIRRVAPLEEVLRAAATSDPEIADIRRLHDRQRLDDVRQLVELLAEVGPLRKPIDEATQLMWALSRSTDFYSALTVDLEWDHDKAFTALNDLLARALLAD
jgi:TetR/AcrR family transcriptional regulator, regulator of autoinduction and epiphytic fitness